jgi:hypothetical protein
MSSGLVSHVVQLFDSVTSATIGFKERGTRRTFYIALEQVQCNHIRKTRARG